MLEVALLATDSQRQCGAGAARQGFHEGSRALRDWGVATLIAVITDLFCLTWNRF
jgi:hypothetical protein